MNSYFKSDNAILRFFRWLKLTLYRWWLCLFQPRKVFSIQFNGEPYKEGDVVTMAEGQTKLLCIGKSKFILLNS
ncbi:hypothetical protein FAES_3253 [Fibrella aestuarina BUZ 2]|uniref:Uncharacterized protein n=1 Tax=Fibrella aestuarina BUZ 2 TaxID=1166018 RepID=I0KAV9_9BACT|nr:hypothetical protein [Fibrella aestuarina]CCH01262.1 hypothetical protein FAES_3253 [Fibrella aestuarina BUZ 2]